MKQIIDLSILYWFEAELYRLIQSRAGLIMILKPLWKSVGCKFPVGDADVKIRVGPSLTGCEAVNSNN